MKINGAVILLTGATGGIGRALVDELAQREARLLISGREGPGLTQLVADLRHRGVQAVALPADLSSPDGAQALAEACLAEGVPDCVIHCAGTLHFGEFADMDAATLDRLMQINLLSPMQLTRALLPAMQARGSGRLLFVGSVFGSLGFPLYSAYAASKFALRGFSEGLRRELQAQMSEQAQLQWRQSECGHGHGIALFDPEWHEGVVGLIASRLREAANRPAVAFARAQAPGMLKGSARSVPGLHLRDVLARIDTQAPGLIERFGGHAMAAGLSLPEQHLAAFQQAFDGICREQLRPEQLERVLETDGPLSATELSLSTAQVLEAAGPWGQGMPEPVFDNDFEVIDARCVGADQRHVRYRLRGDDGVVRVAMHFNGAQTRQSRGRAHVAYTLTVDHWQQCQTLQLRVLDLQPSDPAPRAAMAGDP